MDRMTTGVSPLDQILGGGLPRESISIIAGLPGTGKSVLAHKMAFSNASAQCRTVYLTTLSEPLEKAVRYLQDFDFYDEDTLFEHMVYQDAGGALREEGFDGFIALVTTLLQTERPRLLIIDSFKAIGDILGSTPEYRIKLFELARLLSVYSCTTLWLGEYSDSDQAKRPEFAIADAVIELANQKRGTKDERYFRVSKLRGSHYHAGEHSFRINQQGITVFPRVTTMRGIPLNQCQERVSTGVTGLDELLHGGFWQGTSTMLLGPSGVGKTIASLQFLSALASKGQAGLMVTLQETPNQLRRTAASLELNLGGVDFLYMTPIEALIER